ncbi:MAG: hypothetical protein IKA87_09505, partial [Lentisphaeria bacterium]|nr:hypothetical protein [Lentisphaeria bacterium]
MKKILMCCWALGMVLPLMAFKSKEIKLESGTYLMVESDQLILYVGRLGGRLSRLYYKPAKQELVNVAGRAAFTEMDWEKSGTYDFLYRRGFSVMGEQQGNKYIVTCRGHHMGGGLNFLVVTKRYIIEKGSPVLTVEYDFHNQDAAMTKVRYNLQVHTGLTLVGCGNPDYYMPGTNGIKKGNYWLHNPARGWMGTVAKNGNGMAVTMSFPELYNFLI